MNLTELRSRILAALDRVRWLGPLALRLSLGAVFVQSGWGKLHGLEQVTKYFTELGIPFPAFNATLASTTELVGGTLIGVGRLSSPAALRLSTVMLVAIIAAGRPDIDGLLTLLAFIEVTSLAGFLWLLVAGPGGASLDALLFRRRASTAPAVLRTSPPAA